MTVRAWLSRLAASGFSLALFVVVLGAFVRLSHAGLGCPDWPVCYGQLTWPTAEQHIAEANEAFPHRPVEIEKAWKEQVHRFAAALLGAIVFAMALIANWMRARRRNLLWLAAASAALGIAMYVKGFSGIAAGLSIFAVGLPLLGMWWWRDDWRGRFSAGLLALIIFQAMLGMWTVTLLVKPIIVTAHLLGGMATFVLLWLFWLRHREVFPANRAFAGLRKLANVSLLLVIMQIFLGGWTSTNYAALACPDFPTCQTQWVPPMDFAEGFTLWRGLGIDYEGGVLDNDARVAVHFTHRVGALLVLLGLGVLVYRMRQRANAAPLRQVGTVVGSLLLLQVTLGISVVHFGLPLWLAAAHNGVAALLLASVVTAVYVLRRGA